jgi:hypothetical protein
MTTVTYLSGASNETYSGGAFNYISARIDGINDAANALGISDRKKGSETFRFLN